MAWSDGYVRCGEGWGWTGKFRAICEENDPVQDWVETVIVKVIRPPRRPVFLGGGARPNARFQELWALASVRPRTNVETGNDEPWEVKDLRKTCSTYYDEHVPESSVEILGHSVGGITYRHYAHRAPLAFKAIMTLPQPSASMSLVKGFDGECPCCRRRFADAA